MYISQYDGEHSVIFGNKDSWKDWHLIPASRPVFDPPEVKTNFIDIPGMNGGIDNSEILSGYPLFKNRNGSFEFIVDPDWKNWATVYSEIANYLHGQFLRAILTDDPTYFYEGRFSVDAWKSSEKYSSITINYDVDPYKYNVIGTLDEWIWDTFNFETGIIQNYKLIQIDGTYTFTIVGEQARVSPIFTASSDMTAVFNGSTFPIKKGTHKIYGITFGSGENRITISGSGTLSIDYRGGSL